MFPVVRVTLGVSLLLALITACQSDGPQIQKPSVPSFNLTINTPSVTLSQGDATDVIVSLERLGGFADAVNVTLKGLPADVAASPATLTLPSNTSSATVRLTASATASVTSSTVTLEGVSGTLQKSASLSLVTTKPDPSLPDVFVKRLEWGQSVLKSDLRLVPGKSAVLRAFVNASQAGINGVTVRATASVSGATVGTLDLTAPASVPITDAGTDLASTYWGVLPAAWIKAGLEVRLVVDASRTVAESNEGNNTQILNPVVGTGNKLYLTMVPLIVDGKAPPAFDAAAVAALRVGLMLYWPLADVDIQVRAPYTVKAAAPSSGTVLDEVTSLRTADGSKRYYYGFYNLGGGIGWVGFPAAAGSISLKTVAHELGHNFDLNHAPCGGAGSPDPSYPYAGGGIGSWGFDPRNNTLVDPAKHKDVMGYCSTNWVSDYMYRKAQLFLEQSIPQASLGSTVSDLLLVSGAVRNGQISLEPMQRISGVASAPESGLYKLTLETSSGLKTISFDLRSATHEDGTGHVLQNGQFSFTMPDPGSISKSTVSGYGVTTVQQSATVGLTRVQAVTATTVQRSASSVTVTWDAAAYSRVALAHIAPDGTRTTLALGLMGGSATLELGALGAGQFEVSASDGLNGFKQRF